MLIDAAGKGHIRAGSRARIVSLVPSLTELLFDLDLGRQLVGRSSTCIEPENQIEQIAIVGSTKAIDILTLAELGPSHVLVTLYDTPASLIQEITDLGVEVIAAHCQAPEDNAVLFDLLGDIFEREERAVEMTEALQREIDEVRQSAAGRPIKNALYLTWKDPWTTVSRDTYTANMLLLAGLRSLCEEDGEHYPHIEIDRTLLVQADLVLFSDEPFQFEDEDLQDFQIEYGIGNRPRLEIIDGRSLSWYGKRAIEGLRHLSRLAGGL